MVWLCLITVWLQNMLHGPAVLTVLKQTSKFNHAISYFMHIWCYFYIPLLFENFNHQLFPTKKLGWTGASSSLHRSSLYMIRPPDSVRYQYNNLSHKTYQKSNLVNDHVRNRVEITRLPGATVNLMQRWTSNSWNKDSSQRVPGCLNSKDSKKQTHCSWNPRPEWQKRHAYLLKGQAMRRSFLQQCRRPQPSLHHWLVEGSDGKTTRDFNWWWRWWWQRSWRWPWPRP